MLHVKMREWPELITIVVEQCPRVPNLYQRIVILTVFPETILTGISNGHTENQELENTESSNTPRNSTPQHKTYEDEMTPRNRGIGAWELWWESPPMRILLAAWWRGGAQRLRGTDVGNFIFIFSCDNRCAQRLPTGKSELSTAECSAMGRPHNTMTELRC